MCEKCKTAFNKDNSKATRWNPNNSGATRNLTQITINGMQN